MSADSAKPAANRRGGVPRNMMFSLLSLFVATPLNIIGMLLIARRLGTQYAGLSFAVFAVAIVVYILSGAGVATVLTRRIARDLEDFRNQVAEATGMLLLVTLATFPLILSIGALWTGAKGMPLETNWLFLGAAVAIVGRHVMEFAVGVFRGLERFEFELAIRLAQNGSFCLFAVLYVSEQRGPGSAVAAFAASHWLGAAVACGILVFGYGCVSLKLNVALAKKWFRESLPLGWGDAVRGLGWHVDTILLSLLSTDVAVGLYNVAFRPLMPLRSLPRALASATFPMMSRLRDKPDQVAQVFARSLNALWFLSLPICIAIAGCAEHIIVLLPGPKFIEATRPLQWMIWIAVSLFITTQYRFLFTALDRQRLYSMLVTVVLLLKAGILFALIPRYGIYGAVAGSLVAEFILVVAGLEACRRLGVARVPWLRLARALPGAAVMGAITWQAATWPWYWTFPSVALASLTYVAVGLWCGVFDASEWRRIQELFAKVAARFGWRPRRLPDDTSQTDILNADVVSASNSTNRL